MSLEDYLGSPERVVECLLAQHILRVGVERLALSLGESHLLMRLGNMLM